MKRLKLDAVNRIVGTLILVCFLQTTYPYSAVAYAQELAANVSLTPGLPLPNNAPPPLPIGVGNMFAPVSSPSPTKPAKASAGSDSLTLQDTTPVQVHVLAKVVSHITPEEGGTIELGQMKIEIPPHALDSATDISVEELGSVPQLNSGMENSTMRVAGYRALPHGTRFLKYVKVSMPYDTAIANTPSKRDGLSSYFYDESEKVWTKLERVNLDADKGIIESITTHFTDFITATLKLPDSPKPLDFNPTSIKDIKAADPSAGVPKLEGLEAGQTGAASFQIPLRVPAGRAGIAPQLALSYSSGGSSGWLGQGFDINVGSISIDTRDGVPKFDGNDVYSWAGRELVKESENSGVAIFRPRVESDFSTIVRKPGNGHQFLWEVQEKSGRTTTFGGDVGSVSGAPMKDFQWMQSRVEDTNGNWMRYTYSTDAGDGYRYLSTIDYTLNGINYTGGYYQIRLTNEPREDRRIDMRGGFLSKLSQRLQSVGIWFWNPDSNTFVPIRSYAFEYAYTKFGKSQMIAYAEKDGTGNEFYRYKFDYSKIESAESGKLLGLGDRHPWEGTTSETFSASINGGASLSFGADVGFPLPLHIAGGVAGVKVSGGASSTFENATVLDINGDGIPDLVKHNMYDRSIRLGRPDGSFSSPQSMEIPDEMWDWINSASSQQTNLDLGFFGSITVGGIMWVKSTYFPILSGAYTHSTNTSESKWSYMDVDGDGRVDIVSADAGKYFRNVSKDGTVSFRSVSFGGSAASTSKPAPSNEILKASHLLDPLRMWMAYRDGHVSVQSSVSAEGVLPQDWDGASIYAYAIKGTEEAVKVGKASVEITPTKLADNLEVPDMDVAKGDHLVFRQSSKLLTSNDFINWATKINYTKLNLFSDLTNSRFAVLPSTYYSPNSSDDSLLEAYYTKIIDGQNGRDWTIKAQLPALSDAVKNFFVQRNYFVYQKLNPADYKLYLEQELRENKELNLSGSVWQNFYYYDPLNRQMVLIESLQKNPSQAMLRSIFDKMVDPMGPGFRMQVQSLFPGLELGQSQLDPLSGKVVSNQVQTIPTNADGGSVGYVDETNQSLNARVLAEKIRHVDGTTTLVYLRPYYSDGLHIEVQSSGKINFSGIDTWIDGTPLTTVVQNLGSTSYWLEVSGAWPDLNQKRSFRLFYTPLAEVDSQLVVDTFVDGAIPLSLTAAQNNTVGNAMADLAAANMRARFEASFDTGTYTVLSGLSDADLAFVLWSEALANKTKIPTAKAAALTNQFKGSLTASTMLPTTYSINTDAQKPFVFWIEVLSGIRSIAGFTANYATYDFTQISTSQTFSQEEFYLAHGSVLSNPLSEAQYQTILTWINTHTLSVVVASEGYLDSDSLLPVSLSQSEVFAAHPELLIDVLGASNFSNVITAINSNKANLPETTMLKNRFNSCFVPDTENPGDFLFISASSQADKKFVLWWELSTQIVKLPFLTFNSAANKFIVDSGNSTNPAMLFCLPTHNLLTYTSVTQRILCDSETMFSVENVSVNGSITEYGFSGSRTVNGPVDAVVLSHFDTLNKLTVEKPIFVHSFDSQNDLNDYNYHDYLFSYESPGEGTNPPQNTKISLPVGSVVQNYSGGGNHWFYAEWKGYPYGSSEYSEAKIRYQNTVFRATDSNAIQNTTADQRRDCQVIWPLYWNQERFPGVWHGSMNSRQTTAWDPVSKTMNRSIEVYASYIGPTVTKSYRLGGDEPITASPKQIVPGGNLSWIRQSDGSSSTINIGLGPVPLGIVFASGTSKSVYDVLDVNGDRFPDMVEESGGQIKVYKNLGVSPDIDSTEDPAVNYDPNPTVWGNGSLRQFDNSGVSLSASIGLGSSQAIRSEMKASGRAASTTLDSSAASGATSFSIGGSATLGASYKKNELMDINGDGLPDLVSRGDSSISVQLNNGQGFSSGASFGMDSSIPQLLRDSINARYGNISLDSVPGLQDAVIGSHASQLLSFSGSTSASFNIGASGPIGGPVGLSAGVGISVSTDRSYFDLIDLNGDGLPDLLARKNGKLFVSFNQGDQFAAPLEWGSVGSAEVNLGNLKVRDLLNGGFMDIDLSKIEDQITTVESPLKLDEEISSSTTLGFSVNAGLSVDLSFTIFCWWVPFTPLFGYVEGHVGIGISIGGGINSTTVESSYSDINGDGLPDNVVKTSNGVAVRLNQTGNDGLLTKITLPQGGEIKLDYKRSSNSSDDPSSRWELSKVTRANWTADTKPVSALPIQSTVTEYEYEDGYYSRNDRAFWGYGRVTAKRIDGINFVTRSVSTFDNRNYYKKDRPLQNEVYDQNGLLSRQTTLYNLVPIISAKSYWVQTNSTINTTFDNQLQMTSETRYQVYDEVGNPKQIEQLQNGRTKNLITIEYDPVRTAGSHVLAGLPKHLKVFDSDKYKVLRQRSGIYDAKGNLTEQRSYSSDSGYLGTILAYDAFGNLKSEKDSAGYELVYNYDDVIHGLVSSVSDSLGQTTAWTYDYLQGVEKSQTDTNNKVISKAYDNFGRMISVRAPYDSGVLPALQFVYQTATFPWKAITQNKVNYDPLDSQTIATVVLVDGQGQMLQTKKQTVVTDPETRVTTEGWSVSPWVVVDSLGREKQKGVPLFESGLLNTGIYETSIKTVFGDPDLYTQNTYDSRDRIVDSRLPDGSHQSTEYVMGTWLTETAWRITSTDPELKKKRSWIDASELMLAVIQDPYGKNLSSTFVYDGIGQMLRAIDADGNITTVVYDQLGRKSSLNNPDSGLVSYTYDAKGDLVQKIDSLLRAKNLSINYIYDKHRLVQTVYPDSQVTYVYGSDAVANNVGRLIETSNGETITRTSYGKLGETVQIQRIIKTHQQGKPDYNNTMGYGHNYLGQMTNIAYPNGETVNYRYDAGGQVNSITGRMLGQDVTYAGAIGYDEYGQRVLLTYANGTSTTYAYDPARRWLKSLTTLKDDTQENLQTLDYTFDKVGNVTKFRDTSTGKVYEQNYRYDNLDQLIGANGAYNNTRSSFPRAANYTQSFSYDNIGNLVSKISALSRNPANADDQKLNYSLSYTYSQAKPHQANHVGDTHYQYDENGNLTSMVPDWEWDGSTSPSVQPLNITTTATGRDVADSALGAERSSPAPARVSGTRLMTWDYENRLSTVTDSQMTVSYWYDAEGERRLKVQGVEESVYVDRMYEIDNSSNNPVASIHVYLGDTRLVSKLSIITNPNFYTESDRTYYYHADHLGSSSLITDSKAREYERMAFTPHGEVWQRDSLDKQDEIDLLFTGKGLDKETGWYYFGARYLNPQTGMWLSSDPALGEYLPRAPLTKEDKEANGKLPGMGGIYNPVNFALYHYAGNNPIKFTDPDGREDARSSLAYGFLYILMGRENADKIMNIPNANGFAELSDRLMINSVTLPADFISEVADYGQIITTATGNIPASAILEGVGKAADGLSLGGKLYMALKSGNPKDWNSFFEKAASFGMKTMASVSIDKKNKLFEVRVGANGGYYQLGRSGRLSDVAGLREKLKQDLSPLIGAKMAEKFTEEVVKSITDQISE